MSNTHKKETRAVMQAVAGNNPKELKKYLWLFGFGAEEALGRDMLMLAAARGFTEIAQLLISAGVEVNDKNQNGITPLMTAAGMEHADTARVLIEAGAEINAVSDKGWTALAYSAIGNKTDTMRLLIENGADVTVRTGKGITVEAIAENRNRPEMVQLLKDAFERQRIARKQQKLRDMARQAKLRKPPAA